MITTVVESHLYPTQTWSILYTPLFRGPLPSFLRQGIVSIKITKKNVIIDFFVGLFSVAHSLQKVLTQKPQRASLISLCEII